MIKFYSSRIFCILGSKKKFSDSDSIIWKNLFFTAMYMELIKKKFDSNIWND